MPLAASKLRGKMKKIFIAIMLISSINAFSQADDPADGDGTVPVDGGITLLLAAGAAYGSCRFVVKKARKAAD
jgi:hypothetical protein